MLTFDQICLLIITVLAVFESTVTCVSHWKTVKKTLTKKKRRTAKPRLKVVAGGKNGG